VIERSANTVEFVSEFVANPAATGSLIPSSRFLAQRMLRSIDWRRTRLAVELGPGMGCFTREILARMHPKAKLLAIELNPRFANQVSRSIRDPRLQVVLASALTLDEQIDSIGATHADCIVCSLPFANMSPDARYEILRKSKDSLAKKGSLVLFQYRKMLLPLLQTLFPTVHVEYEWRNFPPAVVFSCKNYARSQA
jgi:phospholipid N-methyltransferase